MKRFLYFLLFVNVMALVSCKDVEWEEGLKPIEISLSLSQIGEQVVELSGENPTYTFEILKNYPMLNTTASLAVMSQNELGGYTPLTEEQYTIDDVEVTFNESEKTKKVTVEFRNITDWEPETTYALGLSLESSDQNVKIDTKKSSLVIILKFGEKGSASNPHRLATLNDLKTMKDKLVEGQLNYFKMVADIDMADESWTILNYDRKYRIIFDGDNHVIKNLRCSGDAASFFGVLNDGACENVTFENAIIEGNNTPIGIVAGIVQSSMVRNVHVSGIIRQSGGINNWDIGKAGGICGALEKSKAQISECSADVDIQGDFVVGGIVGEATQATLTSRSYAKGKIVSTKGFAGGIVGNMYQTTVSDCYSYGEIQVSEQAGAAGGIVGRIDRGAEIYNCYSVASVIAKGNAGGIVGATAWGTNPNGNVIIGCVAWNEIISGTDQNSSRITGFLNGGSTWGASCYAKTFLSVVVPGGKPQTDPYWMDSEELDTTERAKVYNGINADNLISTTQNILKWNPYVWDFSEDFPCFKWEKVY
mgnify:FL=1